MYTIDISSKLSYDVGDSTDMLLKICAASNEHQRVVSENLDISAAAQYSELGEDELGSRLVRLRVERAATVEISYLATVELQPQLDVSDTLGESDIASLPADVYKYLNPSRYCESDLIAERAFSEFGALEPGHARVSQICDWVHGWLTYAPGLTDSTTTAEHVLVDKQGVCRDYAHLAISFCRALGIPARYLSGYAVDLQPPDFHGFFEAFLDGNWYLFDPSKLAPTKGLVRIATGSDAAETSFNTIFGWAALLSMEVSAVEGSETSADFSDTETAVSAI